MSAHITEMTNQTLYKCERCGQIYLQREHAEKCCPDKRCEDCSAELPHNSVFTVCKPCRQARKLKMAAHRDANNWSGGAYLEGREEYFCSIDDLVEYLMDEGVKPENIGIVYGVKTLYQQLNADKIIEDLYTQVHYDNDNYDPFSKKARDEIEDFCADWNNCHAAKYYECDESTVIDSVPELLAEAYDEEVHK
jgi:hypothetical protein